MPLREVRLKDANGNSAGNIDYVLVSYDDKGKIIDFGSLEIQAVYISGNINNPFEYYMEDRKNRKYMDWRKESKYPRPDYLSSSRKRLAPQLIYKGGILKYWGKKQAVVIQKSFFETLPELPKVKNGEKADIAWFIYDLELDDSGHKYNLNLYETVYTKFQPALDTITMSKPGSIDAFIKTLQKKLEKEMKKSPDVLKFGEVELS